jgi:transcriptional regulator GlxA family with amidase domain
VKTAAMKESAGKMLQLQSDEGAKRPPMSLGRPQPFSSPQPAHGPDLTTVFEKHYSVKELASLWNLSDRTIRRMFVGEPGVVEWGACERRRRRAYKTLRIPESVAWRVHRKLRKAG